MFEVSADGKHGKIVSLTESSEELIALAKSYYGFQADNFDWRDGANDMAKVREIYGWQEKFPAFAWCAKLGEGWYLPAIEELEKLTKNKATHDTINCILEAKGKTIANIGEDKSYWSSTWKKETHDLWQINMRNGYTCIYGAADYFAYVRAVATF